MTKPVRILIVEDKSDDARLAEHEIRRILSDCEFQVTETREGFIQALETFQPDVILSDYNLPQFDGMQALQLTLHRAPAIPLIIWTGSFGEDVAVDCVKAGANNFILKENLKQLGPAIVHALEEKELLIARKQAEEALQNNERRFRALIENGLDDISLLASDGTLLWESPSTTRNLGYAPGEFVGRNIFELMHPEDLAWTRDAYARLLQEPGARQRGTFRLRRADGAWRWVEAVATNMLHEPGVKAIVINYHDITEQKHAEIELQQRNADLALVNALNELNNRGESVDAVVNLMAEEIKRNFSAEGATIYLLNPDGRSLSMQQCFVSAKIMEKIEKLIGRAIPSIEIPIREGGYFQSALHSGRGLITSDPKVIQTWMEEFVETAFLPPASRGVVRKLIPQIYKLLNIKSTILVPLISDGKAIGLLDVSSPNHFTEEDLKRIENIGRQLSIALRRRQVEDALHESQASYRNLVETSHDLIWSVDAEARFTFVNRASREICGYEPEELIGRSFFEVLDPEHYHSTLKDFQEAIANLEEIREVETYVRHRDGRQIILSSNSIVLRDDHSNITGVAGSSHDITIRKRVEDVLKEERNLLRTLIDNLPDRVYVMDAQGRKTLSNTADWMASGRKTVEDVIGKTDLDLYPPALAEEFWKLDRAVLNSGQPVINHEEPGLDADGNFVSILTSKIPLRDDEGTVVGLVGIGRDITERKQAEEKLRRSESQYRMATKATNDVIWEWDPRTNELIWSENAAHVFGYPEEEIGPDENWWDDHLHPEDRPRVLAKLDALIAGSGSIWLEEYRFLLKDGSYAYISDRGYLERDEQGTPLRMIGAMSDITPRKEAEIERQALLEIMQGLANTKDLQDLLKLIHGAIAKVIYAENFFVALYQESTGLFEEMYSVDHIDPPAPPSKLENSITAYVFRSGQSLLLTQASFDDLAAQEKVQLVGTDSASWLGVPLKTSGRTIGVMAVQDYQNDNRYSEHDKDFLESIATQVALAIERKKAEEALTLFRSQIDHINDTIEVIDVETGRFIDVNEQACRTHGYTREEYLMLTIEDIDPLESTRQGDKLLRSGSVVFESLHRRKDGSTFPVEVNLNHIRLGRDYNLAVVRDITERKRAEQALREREEQYRAIFEGVQDAIFVESLDGKILMVNERACEMFGYSQAELLTKTVADLVPPSRDILWANGTENSLSAEPRETVNRRANGEIFPIEISGRLQVINGEEVLLVVVRDITECKRVEEELKRSTSLLHATLESTADGILVVEADGRVSNFNRKFLELWRIPSSLVAQGDDRVLLEFVLNQLKDPSVFLSKVEALYQSPEDTSFDELEFQDGRIFERYSQPQRLGDTTVGRVWSFRDVTESKRAEAAEREQRILAEALRDSAETLNSTLSYGEVLDHILIAVGRVVPHDAASILLLEGESAKVVRSHGFDKHGYDPEIMGVELPLVETHNLHKMLETRQPVIVFDTHSYPGWQRMPATDWLRSNVGAPISIYGEIIGFICLDAEPPEYFTPVHAERLEAFANQAAIAIHNARLLQQAQEEIAERKRSEDLLRESNSRFRTLFEASPDAIVLVDPHGDWPIVDCNTAACQMNGYSREEMIGQPIDIRNLKPSDVERRGEYLESIRQAGVLHFEELHKRKDGTVFTVDISTSIIQVGNREVVLGIDRDITERKRAENELRFEKERFEGIVATVPGVICSLRIQPDGSPSIPFASSAFQDVFELTPQEVQDNAAPLFARIYPDDLSRVNASIQEAIRTMQTWYNEFRYQHPTKGEIWIEGQAVPLRGEAGGIWHGFFHDVTERKRAEEEIRRGAKETSALLETSLALTNLDLEATLQTIGNSASTLFLADGCRIFLVEQDGETLHCVLALGENTDAFSNLRIKIGRGVTGTVAAGGKAEIVNDMQNDPRAEQVPGTPEEQEAIMFAPLRERERSIGILSIRRLGGKKPFQQAELELLEAFASMAASAVSKARLFEETQRRLAELHASEERFRQLAENIQEAFWMTDAETSRELYMSPAVETIWGRSIQSLMYEPNAWINSVFSEDRPVLLDAIEKEKKGEKMQFEYRIVRPDGTLRWIWDRAFPIVDDSGRVTRIAGISADITERRESELALAKSQNRYRELFDSSPISIWEEDFSLVKKQIDSLLKNGLTDLREYLSSHPEYVRELASLVKITDVNDASLELYGIDRKEDLLHSLGNLFDSISIRHFEDEIIELMSPLKRFSWEATDVTPAGRQIEVLVNGSIPHGYEEDWSKVIVSIIDVTDRRQAEQELRKLSRAVEQSGSTIVITDTSGNIEYVNPKFTQITGYSSEAVIGQNTRILKSGLTSPEEYKQLWETINSGHEWHGELLNRKKDGTLYWESVTISPILNDRKEITHYVGVKEDITERKQSEIETRRHIAELEAVYENGLSVGRLLEPGAIGDRVIETFARYLPWHHVTIRLRKEGSDDLELVSFNLPNLKGAERADAEQHFIARVNKVGQGLSGWVIQTGIPLRTGNVHVHPQYIDTHAAIQSGLYMPLKVGERVVGVISVESEVPNAFTEQDERLLATLANQTAIAFENARLYEAVQKELWERKRMEDALRLSESHYRALADSITDILFEMDQDLRYTHWNKASEALTGIPAHDAMGKSMEDVFGLSEEQLRIKKIYEDVLRRGQPRTFETTLVYNGEKRSFETTAYPSLRGVSVVAKDVTDRKQTEIIMQKRFELMEYSARHSLNELMLRAVDEVSELTGSTIGFFHFMDEDQVSLGMQTWSTNALQLFEVSSADGTHLPLDRAGAWAEAVRQRRPLIHNDYGSLANRKGLPQGHVPIVREIIIPIIRNERIMAVMGIANKPQDYTPHDLEIAIRLADYAWDVTERKQMEIALQLERNQLVQRVEERTADLSRANSNLARALRVKDEFLANMSHELRTPLNAILGLSESLGEQIAGPLNEKQQKYISTISESGHHLLSLINDILDLAKIDAGQITLDINKVDIHGVCQASLRMIKQLAQKKNQEVSLEIDPGLGLMWADERRLKQMIVNLLGNAVKFTPEYGKLGLEVHGDEEANQIAITIWDNGIGIKQVDLARLFQPFIQLDSGLAREATGTGLGLALVAQMARLHGGSVNAISDAGQGSRFTIVLPWEPALAMDTASRMKITGKFRAIQFDEKSKPTILLVEDTKEVVMMLKDYLELAGYKVFTAQDGIDGIVQARHVRPDLILMDVQMPGMDGFETTRKLRSDPNFRYTPILALTALAMPHDRERCLEAGMDEYISKPVNLKALVKIIQSCLFEQGSRTR